ncbi:hypothetical protein Acsp06_17950 [Actinomycetospora sp. NBRC 106375]|nr:hypothetical protein Acsp06_17950 [Actinomycetospora sp. NBRC 106375]
MDSDDPLWGALDRVAETPTLLVACAFDGALAPDEGDPAEARAEQVSSEALNVLVALHGTAVAVVSDRPADEVAELMFLSGAKGGARIVTPEGVAALRDELGATALVAVGVAPTGEPVRGDVVVGVGEELAVGSPYEVEDVDDVAEVLEELASLRRRI